MQNKILKFKAKHKTAYKSKILIAFSFLILGTCVVFLIEKSNQSFVKLKNIYSNTLIDNYEQKKQLDEIAQNPKIAFAINDAEGKSSACHSGEYVDKDMVKDYLDKTVLLLQEISTAMDLFDNSKLTKNEKIIRLNQLVEKSNELNEFNNKNLTKFYFDHSLVITVSKRGQMIRLSLEELQKHL